MAHYTGAQAYYRSKFALAAFTFDLAEELADSGITGLPAPGITDEHLHGQGINDPAHVVRSQRRHGDHDLATGPVGGTLTGRYFDGRIEARAHEATYDPIPAARGHRRTASALPDEQRHPGPQKATSATHYLVAMFV